MFEKITQEDAITAIRRLVRGNDLRKTTYAVWWKGKLISPSAVVSKHYEIVGSPINRNSFDTSQAQKALLKLGFPIVDTSRDDDFFTKTELNSFSILIKNRFYDKSKPVDKNIGEFISNVVWEKSKRWREKLLELGWFKDNDRYTWQTQSNSKQGNNYKQYTWYRVYPSSNTKKLIFFTVGVGSNGALEYKLDIQANHDFFTDEDRHWFYRTRSELGADMLSITKEDVESENWSSLLKKTEKYFDENLAVLEKISSHFWPEKRLMRIVYNDNNWHFPMARYWRSKWQGRKDKAHHEQYGFGFEEWMFNPRYLIDNIQYGYVRGVDTMPANTDFIDELYLYTIEPQSKNKQLVAKLVNVALLKHDEYIDDDVIEVFESSREKMLSELDNVNADLKFLKHLPLRPNIAFELKNVFFYEEAIPLTDNLIKIPRFIPIKVDDEILETIEDINTSFDNPKLNFNEGNGTGINEYEQQIGGGRRIVNRTHADITNDLHEYLLYSKDYKGYKISTEKTKVGNNLVDCAAKKDKSLDLFEVKTTKSFLINVRLALGQILEYALLDNTIKINKLIIVGPAKPKERDLEYFASLKKLLDISLCYWAYSFDEKKINKKITKY